MRQLMTRRCRTVLVGFGERVERVRRIVGRLEARLGPDRDPEHGAASVPRVHQEPRQLLSATRSKGRQLDAAGAARCPPHVVIQPAGRHDDAYGGAPTPLRVSQL